MGGNQLIHSDSFRLHISNKDRTLLIIFCVRTRERKKNKKKTKKEKEEEDRRECDTGKESGREEKQKEKREKERRSGLSFLTKTKNTSQQSHAPKMIR